jgi:hypothetical protein
LKLSARCAGVTDGGIWNTIAGQPSDDRASLKSSKPALLKSWNIKNRSVLFVDDCTTSGTTARFCNDRFNWTIYLSGVKVTPIENQTEMVGDYYRK